MPRKPRLECPGAIYHVMSREEPRENIFLANVDPHDFTKTFGPGRDPAGHIGGAAGDRA
jgi:hypothetical protein